MPFLTIGIPTFNRYCWLSITLPAIIEQVGAFPAGYIEVVISDNGSTDETWTYLQERASHVPFLRLNRNETNIGAEANFYLVPKLASGRYLYLVGDDDLLNPDALNKIVSALQFEPDYLIVNYDVYDAQLERCVKKNNLNVFKDEIIHNPAACLKRLDASAMSFLSTWVARCEFFNMISEEKYRYFSKWGMSIQADRYFGIKQFPLGRLIASPCLRTRQNTDFNEDNFFSWFLHGSAEVFCYAYEKGMLPKTIIRKRKGQLLRRYALNRIRFERRTGIFKRRKTYEMLRADYGELWSFWLLCVPTMYTPGLGKVLIIVRWLLGRVET